MKRISHFVNRTIYLLNIQLPSNKLDREKYIQHQFAMPIPGVKKQEVTYSGHTACLQFRED
jgi:hypothetical protein